MTRAERLMAIMTLRSQGLTPRQIGDRLGLAPQTVRNYILDPDGSKLKARRASYRGTCRDCGGPTDGSNGRDAAPSQCIYCARGVPSPHRPPDKRRCVPVKLTQIPQEVRVEAARDACRIERGEKERVEILFAAIFPSNNIYWVAPNPAADMWAAA